jgi:protein TonB
MAVPSAAGRVVAPVALEQQAPAWSPSLGLVRGRTYKATVRVVIDESGKVTSATILESVNRIYDQSLLDAVRRWRYQPGTRDGVPIPFTKLVTVTVEAREPGTR